MCHFPLKMVLLGVIIVTMFQHKVHVNRKHTWDHPYDDDSKLHVSVFHSIIERKFDLPLSNAAQNLTICKLINKTFLFTIDRFNKCREFVYNFILLVYDNLNNSLQHF